MNNINTEESKAFPTFPKRAEPAPSITMRQNQYDGAQGFIYFFILFGLRVLREKRGIELGVSSIQCNRAILQMENTLSA